MAAVSRVPHAFILLISLTLAGGGIFVAYGEAQAFLAGGVLPREKFQALATNTQMTSLSTASNHLVLDACYDAMTGVYGRLQPAPDRTAVASNCLAQADAMTASMPTYSYAWYIGALSAAKLSDGAALADRLRQSQLTGPHEQWIAELRVALAEDNLASLLPDVLMGNDKDLAMLVVSSKGIASIAARYVDNPAFRSRITTIVEQLPPGAQRRFVSRVESAAGRVQN